MATLLILGTVDKMSVDKLRVAMTTSEGVPPKEITIDELYAPLMVFTDQATAEFEAAFSGGHSDGFLNYVSDRADELEVAFIADTFGHDGLAQVDAIISAEMSSATSAGKPHAWDWLLEKLELAIAAYIVHPNLIGEGSWLETNSTMYGDLNNS